MSHFTVLVCLTKEEYEGDLEKALEQRLAPYSELLDVAPYQEECYCRESAHSRLVHEALVAKLGYQYDLLRDTFKPIRNALVAAYYKSINEVVPDDLFMNEPEPLDELISEAWNMHRAHYEKTESDLRNSIPKPEAKTDCEDCHGTGISESTYNPKSKWDWYVIGGRWNGVLAENEIVTELDKNIALVSQISGKYQPFAFVDCKGEWYEKGKMGWFGMAANEKKGDNWRSELKEIMDAQPVNTYAVLVDCHI